MTTFAQPDTLTPAGAPVDPDYVRKGRRPYVGGDKRYKLINPETGGPETWSRASTFSKTIADQYHLELWKQRHAVKGLALRSDLYALAAATPFEEKDALNKIVKDAQQASGMSTAANEGTAMHTFADQVDQGLSPYIPDGWREDIAEYSASMAARNIKVVPRMVEKYVACPELRLCGRIDRVLDWNGQLVIGDMKTGKNLSYGWNEMAVQLAIYSRATHWWDEDADAWVEMPKVSRQVALIANTLVGQTRTDWYALPLTRGHEGIDLAIAVRKWRSAKLPAMPVAPVATFAEQLRAASTMPELIAAFSSAQSAGAWCDELDKIALEKQAELSR